MRWLWGLSCFIVMQQIAGKSLENKMQWTAIELPESKYGAQPQILHLLRGR